MDTIHFKSSPCHQYWKYVFILRWFLFVFLKHMTLILVFFLLLNWFNPLNFFFYVANFSFYLYRKACEFFGFLNGNNTFDYYLIWFALLNIISLRLLRNKKTFLYVYLYLFQLELNLKGNLAFFLIKNNCIFYRINIYIMERREILYWLIINF